MAEVRSLHCGLISFPFYSNGQVSDVNLVVSWCLPTVDTVAKNDGLCSNLLLLIAEPCGDPQLLFIVCGIVVCVCSYWKGNRIQRKLREETRCCTNNELTLAKGQSAARNRSYSTFVISTPPASFLLQVQYPAGANHLQEAKLRSDLEKKYFSLVNLEQSLVMFVRKLPGNDRRRNWYTEFHPSILQINFGFDDKCRSKGFARLREAYRREEES